MNKGLDTFQKNIRLFTEQLAPVLAKSTEYAGVEDDLAACRREPVGEKLHCKAHQKRHENHRKPQDFCTLGDLNCSSSPKDPSLRQPARFDFIIS